MFFRIWAINEAWHQVKGPTVMCDIENNKERDDLVRGLLPQLLMNDRSQAASQDFGFLWTAQPWRELRAVHLSAQPGLQSSVCMKLGCVSTVITFWSVIEFMKTVSSSKIILPRDTASINVCINIFEDVYTTVILPNNAIFSEYIPVIKSQVSKSLDFLNCWSLGPLHFTGCTFHDHKHRERLLGTIQEMRLFISSLIMRRII